MKLNYSHNSKNPTYTIAMTVRKGDKIKTEKVATIGKHSDLLKITDDPLASAQKKVDEYNEKLKNSLVECTAVIDLTKKLEDEGRGLSKPTYLNIGYFFIQAIYNKLRISQFFDVITDDRNNTFSCDEINRFLVYARILDPKSKLGTFDDLATYFEKPEFDYHQIFRFMDILEEYTSEYLKYLYIHSSSVVERNKTVMYYHARSGRTWRWIL